ncbi:hypothetical protein GGR55DRAFT_635952 [Xylaria sp. FL0064]|nr:hypothetical protein GGR55DRAFT_635952 [Xylaria sp. FL0064]
MEATSANGKFPRIVVRDSMDRAVQWAHNESSAIQQWRGITESQERAIHVQPRIRHRDNRPRSTDSLRSDAGAGLNIDGPGDSVYINKKPRDVTAHLKYLVRGYLRQTRGSPSIDGSTKKLTNQDSFVPSPKVTFLIDKPTNLTCQICHQAQLKLAVTAEDPAPDMACILPCAHIACCECMNAWLESHTSCPFCRVSLIHTRCKHQVKPRLIAQDTIHSIPQTVPNGGKIGAMCFRCTEKDRREITVERWTKLADNYKAARRKAEKLGTDAAKEEMHKAQKAFERVPEDNYMVLSGMQLHQW